MLTFLHSSLLWWLVPLVGLPVLIHLINMMRHRRVQWAAMEFLLQSQKKNRTWVLLKQLILLLMRMAALAAVIVVLAQPLLHDQWGRFFGGSTTHHVVLLDDSFSMSDRWEDTSAFDQAKQAVERIGRDIGMEGEQKFTLLRFSQAGRAARGTQPDLLQEPVDSEFPGLLQDKLAAMSPSQSDAGPTPAIEAIEQLLGRSDSENRVVYAVSDFRAREWDNPTDLKKHLSELSDAGARLYLINCVESTRPNLAIADLAPGPGTQAAGVPLFMEVTVKNFGPVAVKDVPVSVETDGQTQPAFTIAEVPAGKAVKERFPVRFPTAGPHRITARLQADAVAADNARFAVVDFPAAVPVLLIDGDPQARDAKWLASVFAVGGQVTTGLNPRIEQPRFLAVNPLESFRAIYLLNVDRLDKAAVAALERYLAAGGGVGFFVGDRTRADFFNQELYRAGQGPFPAPLANPAELLVDNLQKTPDLDVADHPIFHIFQGARNSFLPLVIVSRYYAVPKTWKPESEPGVQVIARLRNGAPLAMEKKFGRGNVVAFLTTAAPVWNNWARGNPSFPVVLLELQAFLASQGIAEPQYLVGAPFELRLDPAQYESQVQFRTPRADAAPLGSTEAALGADGRLAATLDQTDACGYYEARLIRKDGKVEVRQWACNVQADEGDLTALGGEELASRLEGLRYEYHPAAAFQYDSQQQAGYNLSDLLLYALIGLLLAEQAVAWSASYHTPRRTVVQGGAR